MAIRFYLTSEKIRPDGKWGRICGSYAGLLREGARSERKKGKWRVRLPDHLPYI
ncbi:hypothetical protein [Dyadobacter luteus]|nr:hypothetical protein [Dyadobacter luteus]